MKQCDYKITYRTKQEAKSAILDHFEEYGIYYHTYKCKEGDHYHLTSPKDYGKKGKRTRN